MGFEVALLGVAFLPRLKSEPLHLARGERLVAVIFSSFRMLIGP
jgi:hypothetical protein